MKLIQNTELFKIEGMYDFIYHLEDKYNNEIRFITDYFNLPKQANTLDVGCGSGIHVAALDKLGFKAQGVDLNDGMLKSAMKRSPHLKFTKANMVNFAIDETFDLITCMYGAINYLESEEDIKATFKNFYNHLKPKGAILIDVQWSNTLPNKPYVVKRGTATVIRRWQSKQGINNSDLYSVSVHDTEKNFYFLETHHLFFQDPFWMKLTLKDLGFNNVHLFEKYNINKNFTKDTLSHEATLVATK